MRLGVEEDNLDGRVRPWSPGRSARCPRTKPPGRASSPNSPTAQRMAVLAGAVSNSLLTRARSSVLIGWSLTLISVTGPHFSGASSPFPRGPPPALDALSNAGFSIHDQNGHDLKRPHGNRRRSQSQPDSANTYDRRPRAGASVTALVRPVEHPLGHLDLLESLAIFIIREVAAESERPVLLFSGGKDSAVLLHLASKAFRPGADPLPGAPRGHRAQLLRGPRTTATRRSRRRALDSSWPRCRTPSTRAGWPIPGAVASRNRLQTTTLLDAINANGFDAAFGGARRDEDKARAKERVLSFRDSFGQWDPKRQRPELWQLYQGTVRPGEHLRAFPLSDWTELDIWQYIRRERIELPSIYYAHEREVVERDGMLLAVQRVGDPASRARRSARRPSASAPSATPRAPVRSVPRLTRSRRSSARCRPRAFRNVARRGPTTGSPRRRWKTASVRAISRVDDDVARLAAGRRRRDRRRHDGPPPVRHHRIGRRRQEHAHRPPPLRHPPALRRPGRPRSKRPRNAGASVRSTSRSSPTACAPSASRASRSTSRTGTRPRRTASSSSPTAPATCSTRAIWRPAPPPPTSPSSSSTPPPACASNHAGTSASPPCSASTSSSSAPTRWTWSIGTVPPISGSSTRWRPWPIGSACRRAS